jgi:hypothetical protein
MVTRFPRWAIQFHTPIRSYAFRSQLGTGPGLIVLQSETIVPHAVSQDR